MWKIEMSGEALKDAKKVKASPYFEKVKALLALLVENPFQNPPPYEKLEPPTADSYSRRINRQHRLTYTIHKNSETVKILRMWTHYE